MPCSGLGRSPTLPATPGSATTWRPGWSPRRTGTHRGRVETAQRPHARQLSSRAPSWPRTRPSTRHPDGCRGVASPMQYPRPPAARHRRPATGVPNRRRGEVPGRLDPPRIRLGPGAVTCPQPLRRSGRWSSSARRGGERGAGVPPVLLCVQRPVEGRDHDANHCDVQDQATSHRPQRRPPDSATAAVMECGACLSTACLHPAHCGVFHVEQVRSARRSR